LSALASISVGRWLDARGPRALMTAGSVVGHRAHVRVGAAVESLPALYAVWFLMGFAMAATLYEPAFAVVVSWVRARPRPRAAHGDARSRPRQHDLMPIEAALLERLGWRTALDRARRRARPDHDPDPRAAPASGHGPTRPPPPPTRRRRACRWPGRANAVFWVLSIAFLVSTSRRAAVTTAPDPVPSSTAATRRRRRRR